MSYASDLSEAAEALQPFYDPGDDGDAVTLALDLIAAVLGKKARIEVPAEKGLVEVLASLDAPEELQTGISELYVAALGAEYGGGLTKKGAKIVNNHVQDYVPDVLEFARDYRRPEKGSKGTRRKSAG